MTLRNMLVLAAAGLTLVCGPVLAQSPAAKAMVDAAKVQGAVGEQADGFLGLVNGKGDPALVAAVRDINAGRAEAYKTASAKAGVSVEAAGQATAQQLFARLPPGAYYRPLDGAWTRK